jgi:hypothetical protein
LKNQTCLNSGCQFLHEPGEEADSFTKDELIPQSKVTPKAPPFPLSGGSNAMTPTPPKHDDKEESALPTTAGWAKPPGTSKVGDDMMVIKNRAQTSAKRLLTGQSGASDVPLSAGAISSITPTMVFPETRVIESLVKPLRFIMPHFDPFLAKLASSGRQPKYSGPFAPFREEHFPLKPIANMKSNLPENSMDLNNLSVRKLPGQDTNTHDPQISYVQDAFRSVFPNVNVMYAPQNQAQPSNYTNNMAPEMLDNRSMSQSMPYNNRNALGFLKGMEQVGNVSNQSNS